MEIVLEIVQHPLYSLTELVGSLVQKLRRTLRWGQQGVNQAQALLRAPITSGVTSGDTAPRGSWQVSGSRVSQDREDRGPGTCRLAPVLSEFSLILRKFARVPIIHPPVYSGLTPLPFSPLNSHWSPPKQARGRSAEPCGRRWTMQGREAASQSLGFSQSILGGLF